MTDDAEPVLTPEQRDQIFRQEVVRRQGSLEVGEMPLPSDPQNKTHRSKKLARRLLVAGAIVVTTAVIGVFVFQQLDIGATDTPESRSHTITGVLVLTGLSGFSTAQEPCEGRGGFNDIDEGAQVLVMDGEGKTLATSELGGGQAKGEKYDFVPCSFEFTVDSVPQSDFYEVTVADRSGITFSRADMEDSDWTISLSLGA